MSADDPDLLAVLRASAPRRWAGMGALGLLALALLWLGAQGAQGGMGGGWTLGFVLAGAGFLGAGWALWRGTAGRIELRRSGLVTGEGRVLAALDEIASVNRGTFAAKPSNGFLVRLRGRRGLLWAPGLYWRFGRALGIGGATSGASTRAMADLLAALLAERERPGR